MKRSSFARWAMLIAIAAAIVIAAVFFPVVRWTEALIAWVRGVGIVGTFIYGLVYAGGTVLMIPGTLLTAAAGLLYGVLVGVLVVSPASVLGATLAFLIGRYVARDWVAAKLRNHPKFAAIDRAIEKNGFKVVLLMRLQPVFIPFALLNYALGLTRVRLREYIAASWIGMLPATVLYVYFGSIAGDAAHLLHGNYKHNIWSRGLLWGGFAAALLLVFVFVRIARRALQEQLDGDQARGNIA